ncbi:MAG TPA: GxxExxY protein [Chryseosolibacter sp.]
MRDNEITEHIIGCAIRVHRNLGPGLLESVYVSCLMLEFKRLGLKFEREKSVPLYYEGEKLDCNFRLDLLVEDRIVVETKSVDDLNDIHVAQLLTYLKLTKKKIGLLINFNVPLLKDGIKR